MSRNADNADDGDVDDIPDEVLASLPDQMLNPHGATYSGKRAKFQDSFQGQTPISSGVVGGGMTAPDELRAVAKSGKEYILAKIPGGLGFSLHPGATQDDKFQAVAAWIGGLRGEALLRVIKLNYNEGEKRWNYALAKAVRRAKEIKASGEKPFSLEDFKELPVPIKKSLSFTKDRTTFRGSTYAQQQFSRFDKTAATYGLNRKITSLTEQKTVRPQTLAYLQMYGSPFTKYADLPHQARVPDGTFNNSAVMNVTATLSVYPDADGNFVFLQNKDMSAAPLIPNFRVRKYYGGTPYFTSVTSFESLCVEFPKKMAEVMDLVKECNHAQKYRVVGHGVKVNSSDATNNDASGLFSGGVVQSDVHLLRNEISGYELSQIAGPHDIENVVTDLPEKGTLSEYTGASHSLSMGRCAWTDDHGQPIPSFEFGTGGLQSNDAQSRNVGEGVTVRGVDQSLGSPQVFEKNPDRHFTICDIETEPKSVPHVTYFNHDDSFNNHPSLTFSKSMAMEAEGTAGMVINNNGSYDAHLDLTGGATKVNTKRMFQLGRGLAVVADLDDCPLEMNPNPLGTKTVDSEGLYHYATDASMRNRGHSVKDGFGDWRLMVTDRSEALCNLTTNAYSVAGDCVVPGGCPIVVGESLNPEKALELKFTWTVEVQRDGDDAEIDSFTPADSDFVAGKYRLFMRPEVMPVIVKGHSFFKNIWRALKKGADQVGNWLEKETGVIVKQVQRDGLTAVETAVVGALAAL